MYLQPGRVVSFEVFRRKREKREWSARVLPYLAPTKPGPPSSPFRDVELARREVEHRQRMLQHLSGGRADCAGVDRQYETIT